MSENQGDVVSVDKKSDAQFETFEKQVNIKETFLTRTIPSLPLNLAIMVLLCNIFFPSSGTFFMACIGDKVRKTQFILGALQLITTFLILGYFWSIFWGILAIKKSH